MEHVFCGDELLAIIIRAEYDKHGVDFITAEELPMQLAYMHHPKDHIIAPHRHLRTQRIINDTKEVLWIKEGKLQVEFYDENKNIIKMAIVKAGDVIFLNNDCHGFRVLEEVKMVEVKQGPFLGDKDKIKF